MPQLVCFLGEISEVHVFQNVSYLGLRKQNSHSHNL